MPNVNIDVYANTHGAPEKLKPVEDGLGGIDRKGDEAKKTLQNLWPQFAIGSLAADALQKGIGFLKNELRDTIRAAIESEEAESNLRLALETTGRQVDQNFDHFNDYATSLMKVSRFDDEAIKSTQALLLQLTDLDQYGIDRATEGALGLAAVFSGQGMTLESAAQIVAKAMEGNVEMLGRYIPKVKDGKTAAEKAAIAQAELAKMFDRAKGSVDTAAGQADRLKIAWGEFKEKIGGEWLAEFTDAIKGLIKVIDGLAVASVQAMRGIKMMTGAMRPEDILKMDKGLREQWVKGEKAVRDFVDSLKVVPLSYKEVLEASKTSKEGWEAYMKSVRETDEMLAKNKDTIVAWIDKQLIKVGLLKEEEEITGPVTTKTIIFTEAIQTQTSELARAGINLQAYLGGLQDAPGYFNAVLPPARDMIDVLKQAADAVPGDKAFNEMPKGAKAAVDTTKNYFDGLYNDIAQGFGDTIEEWMSGMLTFEDFLGGIWDSIKSSFFRMIGEITADTVLNGIRSFFGKMTDSASGAVTSAGKSIGQVVSGLGTGLGALITSLATAIAAAAVTLAAAAPEIAIVAALALAIYAGFSLIKKIFGSKGGGGGDDLAYWLKLIYEDLGSHIMEKFDGLKGSVDLSRDSLNPIVQSIRDTLKTTIAGYLADIRDYTSALKDIQFGASGLSTTVSRPTLFMAGERGAEHVSISPNFQFGAQSIALKIDGRVIAESVAPYVPQMSRDGRWKMHENGIIRTGR